MIRRSPLLRSQSSSLLGLFRSAVDSLIPGAPETLLSPAAPVTLASFSDHGCIDSWRVVTDGSSELDGASTAAVQLIADEAGSPPFARFSGSLSKKVLGHKEKVRTGFAALRSSEWKPPKVLSEMDVLELRVRSDERTYAVNLNVDSFNQEDIYQGVLRAVAPGANDDGSGGSSEGGGGGGGKAEWRTLALPLRNFALTGRGRLRESQRVLDGEARIRSVGILLADHIDGPFQLDIASISCRASSSGSSSAGGDGD